MTAPPRTRLGSLSSSRCAFQPGQPAEPPAVAFQRDAAPQRVVPPEESEGAFGDDVHQVGAEAVEVMRDAAELGQ